MTQRTGNVVPKEIKQTKLEEDQVSIMEREISAH